MFWKKSKHTIFRKGISKRIHFNNKKGYGGNYDQKQRTGINLSFFFQ